MKSTVIEKPIPETSKPGIPDPRVRQLWLDARKNPGKPAQGLDEIRASMGWPNLDLCTEPVRSEPIELQTRAGAVQAILNRPEGLQGKAPVIVYFHGGGFMGGSTTTVQNPCRLLAEKAQAVVVNLAYRLAPEHPFPAPLEDCHDAVRYIAEHAEFFGIDPSRIIVAGDSAGGNLAAACSVLDSAQDYPVIAAQLLVYPVVDQRPELAGHLAWSLEQYRIDAYRDLVEPSIYGLKNAGPWFSGLYLNGTGSKGTSPDDPRVSPILADPARFPPTLVITAEYDFLRIEGEAFAQGLTEAGCQVRTVRYRGMDHAFFDKLGLFPQASDAVQEMADFVRNLDLKNG